MNTTEIAKFQKAISVAAWKMDFLKFAEAIGHDPKHDYTREKFRQFSELNKALNRFDAEILRAIVEGVEL